MNDHPTPAAPIITDGASLVSIIEDGQFARRRKSIADHPEWTRWPLRLSSIGTCPRQLALRLRGEGRELDARALRIFDLGGARGEAFAEYIRHACGDRMAGGTTGTLRVHTEKTMELQLPVSESEHEALQRADALAVARRVTYDAPPEWNPRHAYYSAGNDRIFRLVGHADIIIEHDRGSNAPLVFDVIEVKTKAAYGFDKLPEEGPGDEYDAQLSAYTLALAQAYRPAIERGRVEIRSWFLFENKDSSSLHAFPWRHARNADEVKELEAVVMPRARAIRDALLEWESNPDGAPSLEAAAPKFRPYPEKKKGGSDRLPWQCSYCSHGPLAGGCFPDLPIRPRAKRNRYGEPSPPDFIVSRGAL